jgi:hypothetical protein
MTNERVYLTDTLLIRVRIFNDVKYLNCENPWEYKRLVCMETIVKRGTVYASQL